VGGRQEGGEGGEGGGRGERGEEQQKEHIDGLSYCASPSVFTSVQPSVALPPLLSPEQTEANGGEGYRTESWMKTCRI